MQGVIEEERIDSFNAPYYAPSPEEVRRVIEDEGSFLVNHLEAFEVDWNEGSSTDHDSNDDGEVLVEKLSRGQQVAKTVRAVVEPMLVAHFGRQIMDPLFPTYGQLVDDYFSKTVAKHFNLVISLTRNSF